MLQKVKMFLVSILGILMLALPAWQYYTFGSLNLSIIEFVKMIFYSKLSLVIFWKWILLPALILSIIFTIIIIKYTKIRLKGFIYFLLTTLVFSQAITFFNISEIKIPHSKFYQDSNQGWNNNEKFYIAHGGGGIDGKRYTNSKEAFEASIKNGFKYIELDLLITTDNKILAAHDWKFYNSIVGNHFVDKPRSSNEIATHKIYGMYTPLDGEMIYSLLLANPEITLVVDKIEDYKLLMKEIPLPERMIVEATGYKQYEDAKAAGFPYIALEIRKGSALPYIYHNKVDIILSSTQNLEGLYPYQEELHKNGVTILTYTINESSFMEKNLGKNTSLVITDFWLPKSGTLQEKMQ